ncbi:NmrA family protein [Beutenbergia cavernae DSM 12333]|uniref:NmrA family protein n=1 Tax=Beutenbergia cavernae (strain ATCC BAA-8 / DSM 12333 / CCUG 43141 / JCM 11478 / NBRC 16432 / NCIMB 13614 / HKI 0122) TaxID=471853 RepID=C5C3I4_BEUC1|nr:SDR family NAD(P)-dependent oxidoreductase [Beutenbergia cavernae]ACQ81893.1 NmrA family protein [Beutenbergia cavernae DSM 12333]
MTVLVTGATGTVGREVVRALLERGAAVRALSREPATAGLDRSVEVVRGDLTDPASVDRALAGVDAVHLITFDGPRRGGGGAPLQDPDAVLRPIREHGVGRVTVLQNGYPGPLEEALPDSGVAHTMLLPVEFMANYAEWAEPIKEAGGVEEPYADRRSAPVHPADIGDVAALALTEDGHAGRTYTLTGPDVLTLRDKLDAIGAALGRELRLTPLSEDEGVARWRAQGMDDEAIGFMRWVYGDPPEVGYTVTDTVPRVTGRPARSFAQWAVENVGLFR